MRIAGRIAMLTALWLLAWGDISVGNVLSGVVVAAALLAAFPPSTSTGSHVRIELLGALRLAAHVAVQLFTANLVMARQLLRPRPSLQPGVIEHRLAIPSEHLITVMTGIIALSPGTMTVDVDTESTAIYVHFLFLDDIDAARRDLRRLELLASRAISVHPHLPEHGAPMP